MDSKQLNNFFTNKKLPLLNESDISEEENNNNEDDACKYAYG